MRTIIAGSRTITNPAFVHAAIREFERHHGYITHVLSGMADGPDLIGRDWAIVRQIPFTEYPVSDEEWLRYGKAAGPLRNSRMVQDADALLAIWDGVSRGTRDVIRRAKAKKLVVMVRNA